MEETQISGKLINNGIVEMSEGEYRRLEVDSSSSIKVFADSRQAYYKKFVLKQWEEEEDGIAVILGKLVDCLLLGNEGEFEEKFITSSIVNAPTATMELFVEALYKRASDATNEEGELTRDMRDLTLEAYNDVKFDRDGKQIAFKRANVDSYENWVTKFMSGEAYTYFKEIMEVRKLGKTVITVSLLDQANRIVEKLKTSPNTWRIFAPENVQVFNQLKIDGFAIDGLALKGMLDRVHVWHMNKSIQLYDLKVTWNVEDFYQKYYLIRRTYFQAYIYHRALSSRTVDLGFDYSEYTIAAPQFIVADSANFYEPLVYELNHNDLEDAFAGFRHKNRYYKGLKEVIGELKWAKSENVWNQSMENWKNDGIVKLGDKKEE